MNGTDERLKIKNLALGSSSMFENYDGLVKYIEIQAQNDSSATAKKWAGQFSKCIKCPECNGERLNKEALHFKIADKNISQVSNMDIIKWSSWLNPTLLTMLT